MEQDKSRHRRMKRVVKRAGSKHRRRDLKRQLGDDPEVIPEANFGRHSSANLNGVDRDRTRRGTHET